LVRLAPDNPPRADVLLVELPGGGRSGAAVRVPGIPSGLRPSGAPSWTPDGQTLLFTAALGNEGVRSDIFAIGVDGRGLRRLTSLGDVGSPLVSPDGLSVVFARRTPGATFAEDAWNLWAMNADGASQRPITPAVPGQADHPGSWSPDGATIAFTRSSNPSVGPRGRLTVDEAVWIVGHDGAGPRQLGEGSAPAFSPDGTRLAYVSTRDRYGEVCSGEVCRLAAEVYLMGADGAGQRRITVSGASEDSPAWSPDGGSLAVVRSGDVHARSAWLLSADGGCVRPLGRDLSGTVSYEGPAWRPGGVAWSPCAHPDDRTNVARRAPLPVPALAAVRRSRAYPLVWLGPEYRRRRLTAILRSDADQRLPGVGRVPRLRNTTFIYGDCASPPAGDDCRPIHIQVWPVCAVPPPGKRGPVPQPMRRVTVGDAVAFLYGGQWDLYTGSVVVRGFFTGRISHQVMRSLGGLNPLAAGVRPGRTLPPPRPGVVEGTLPCSRAWDFLGRQFP
jgi:hypothetical protein